MKSHAIEVGRKELRQFGFIMFVVLAGGFGVTIPWLRGGNYHTTLIVVGSTFAIFAATVPLALRPIYVVWMKIGEVLGWVNSRIILSIVYYGFVVPYGIAMKIKGRDVMRRKWRGDDRSYRIEMVGKASTRKNMELPY